MAVTLPFVLLLLDYWPLGRFHGGASLSSISKVIVEKTPLFVLAGTSCVVTWLVQGRGGTIVTLNAVPFEVRVANALNTYIIYIVKTVWPGRLAVFYPYPLAFHLIGVTCSLLLLSMITWLTVRCRRRYPFLVVGWLWYLGTLVPVIGLVQVGSQAMADRYTYLPLVGLFLMIAWIVPESPDRNRKSLTAAGALAVIAIFVVLAFRQAGYWRDGVTLFKRALQVTRESEVAHSTLGLALAEKGLLDKAIAHYRRAITLNPGVVNSYFYLGDALKIKGQLNDAIRWFEGAVRLFPDSASLRYNLALLLFKDGRADQALVNLQKATELDPGHAKALCLTGIILYQQGRYEEAVRYFTEAITVNSDFAEGHYNLAMALRRMNRSDEAARCLRKALEINPRLNHQISPAR
jgi:Flp pilus assembly protein TadD